MAANRIFTQVICFLCSLGLSACADDQSATGFDAGDQLDGARGDSSSAGDTGNDVDAPSEDNEADASPTPICMDDAEDADRDGFLATDGDCNDCDPNVNPGAFDVADNGVDEDCSGKADDTKTDCDQDLELKADDAFDAAKGIGLCGRQQGASWGVISARWVFPDGKATSTPMDGCSPARTTPHPLSRGLLPSFGSRIRPHEGETFLALSSGVARSGSYELTEADAPGSGVSPGGAAMCTESLPPIGFPKASPACPGVTVPKDEPIFNGVALELAIKVPSNAYGFRYEHQFFSMEYPQFICKNTNDAFVALLESEHPSVPADKNISFDAQGNLVSVNTGLFQVCDGVTAEGRVYKCPQGTADLGDTGFLGQVPFGEKVVRQGGATGWLRTEAAVVPGETIKLRFAIWDAGDPQVDSTVLIDNFSWLVDEGKPPEIVKPETVILQ